MFSGLEEAVIRNIKACKQLAETVSTAYGPIGMNKMVINHLGKLFVTNDAATIIRELEVIQMKTNFSWRILHKHNNYLRLSILLPRWWF